MFVTCIRNHICPDYSSRFESSSQHLQFRCNEERGHGRNIRGALIPSILPGRHILTICIGPEFRQFQSSVFLPSRKRCNYTRLYLYVCLFFIPDEMRRNRSVFICLFIDTLCSFFPAMKRPNYKIFLVTNEPNSVKMFIDVDVLCGRNPIATRPTFNSWTCGLRPNPILGRGNL